MNEKIIDRSIFLFIYLNIYYRVIGTFQKYSDGYLCVSFLQDNLWSMLCSFLSVQPGQIETWRPF